MNCLKPAILKAAIEVVSHLMTVRTENVRDAANNGAILLDVGLELVSQDPRFPFT